jgi:hypothetical protein
LIPWNAEFALSKDAFNANNQTKKTTASVYEHAGLRVFMCDMSKGSVEASIHEMRSRIATGRFFIFKSCEALIEEMRLYRANESGIIVKRDDDLLAATRYALLALSKATVPGTARQKEEFTVRVEQYQPLTAYEGA